MSHEPRSAPHKALPSRPSNRRAFRRPGSVSVEGIFLLLALALFTGIVIGVFFTTISRDDLENAILWVWCLLGCGVAWAVTWSFYDRWQQLSRRGHRLPTAERAPEGDAYLQEAIEAKATGCERADAETESSQSKALPWSR